MCTTNWSSPSDGDNFILLGDSDDCHSNRSSSTVCGKENIAFLELESPNSNTTTICKSEVSRRAFYECIL
ncbi:hypothetical protein [Candidatus Ichthyocystis sparus]|uniref:hypothetical protein n=1 Tax=Candidatus Ichthyocystis sparus TaxID=1561004 RepID=UPI001147539C|nr:hypothetical protein [Candidatus Ichthyocystis sparus]